MVLLLYQIPVNKVSNGQYFYVKFRNELNSLGIQLCPNAILFSDDLEDQVRNLLKSYDEKWNELTGGDPNLRIRYIIMKAELDDTAKAVAREALLNELRSLIGRFISVKTPRAFDTAVENFKVFCSKAADFDLDAILVPIQDAIDRYLNSKIDMKSFGVELLGILTQS